MTPMRILVADDQAAFRLGIRAVLSVAPDIELVGEAGDGEEAARLARALRPDVVLMDLRMPVLDGVQATALIQREVPRCRIIALTTFDDDALVFAALAAGACAYLLKGVDTATLLGTIRGSDALSPEVATKVIGELRRLSAVSPPKVGAHDLSQREVEVAKLIAIGASNKDIANALDIAPGTVKNHVTRVLEKLKVGDRTQAALRARDLGLVR